MVNNSSASSVGRAVVMGWLILLCSAVSCMVTSKDPDPTALRTLMVGNSFTFWNGGLWFPLQDLLGGKSVGIRVRPSVQGGASLATHAARQRLTDQIAEGAYDLVILQGDIPESTVEAFEVNAATLVARVRKSGAEPLLFMTWDYDRLDWLSLEDIIAAHHRVADAHQLTLAPVGDAFLRVRKLRPGLDLYDSDREHPSLYGSYLALVILHATITGGDPRDELMMPRAFRRVSESDAEYLRQIAWQVVKDERERVQAHDCLSFREVPIGSCGL